MRLRAIAFETIKPTTEAQSHRGATENYKKPCEFVLVRFFSGNTFGFLCVALWLCIPFGLSVPLWWTLKLKAIALPCALSDVQ